MHIITRATVVCVMAVALGTASANELVFQPCEEFSGATPPAGTAPWLTSKFDDAGGVGSVTMTLETTNIIAEEYVSKWLFNVAAAIDPTSLVFSIASKVGSFTDPTISTGADLFKADGDGYYDIMVAFETGGTSGERFTAGDSLVCTITAPLLTAYAFDALSASKDQGKAVFPTAAHVQGIGPQAAGSGWVTVPESCSAVLLVLGASILSRRR